MLPGKTERGQKMTDKILGNNQVNVSSTGVMTVNSVSTDLLFNGTNTLILDGGSAS